jgi:hypothetical protein
VSPAASRPLCHLDHYLKEELAMDTATHNNGATQASMDDLAATEDMYDRYAESAPTYMSAAATRAAGVDVVAHYRRLLEIACYDEQVIEQIAGRHRHEGRLGRYGSLLVVSLTGVAETALAYFGLTLAVPSTSQAGDSTLLSLISQQGALLAAIAIGVLSTVVTMVVGRQLSLAHRGLVADPSHRGGRMEEQS